jgi:hypothetical protein
VRRGDGSPWNALALVAALGLAAAVGVAAVIRSERPGPAPRATPTPVASPSPTPTEAGELGGVGPHLVLALPDGTVVAHDLPSGRETALGAVTGPAVAASLRQPTAGRAVVFLASDGSVWRVTRTGLERVARVPPSAGRRPAAAAASPDGARLAVLLLEPAPTLAVVDAVDGSVDEVRFRGQGAPGPIEPGGFSLGGTVVYGTVWCGCPEPEAGLYAVEVPSGVVTPVPSGRSVPAGRFVLAPEGQTLLFGTASSRPCPDRPGRCEAGPFSLRRLAAGERLSETLRQAPDASLDPAALSPDGRLVLLARRDPAGGPTRFELAEASTGRARPTPLVARIPPGASALALLDETRLVVRLAPPDAALAAVGPDRVTRVGPPGAVLLGWLR